MALKMEEDTKMAIFGSLAIVLIVLGMFALMVWVGENNIEKQSCDQAKITYVEKDCTVIQVVDPSYQELREGQRDMMNLITMYIGNDTLLK